MSIAKAAMGDVKNKATIMQQMSRGLKQNDIESEIVHPRESERINLRNIEISGDRAEAAKFTKVVRSKRLVYFEKIDGKWYVDVFGK